MTNFSTLSIAHNVHTTVLSQLLTQHHPEGQRNSDVATSARTFRILSMALHMVG